MFDCEEYFIIRDCKISKKLNAQDLFDGRLEAFGIREHQGGNRRCLTDGSDFLWVYMDHEGWVSTISAIESDRPSKIAGAIGEAFDIKLFTRDEPQYWGFGTQEEWDTAKKRERDEARKRLYDNVCAYVRGENINLSTIEERKAKIAKALFQTDSALMQSENKDKLLAGIEAVYAATYGDGGFVDDVPF